MRSRRCVNFSNRSDGSGSVTRLLGRARSAAESLFCPSVAWAKPCAAHFVPLHTKRIRTGEQDSAFFTVYSAQSAATQAANDQRDVTLLFHTCTTSVYLLHNCTASRHILSIVLAIMVGYLQCRRSRLLFHRNSIRCRRIAFYADRLGATSDVTDDSRYR